MKKTLLAALVAAALTLALAGCAGTAFSWDSARQIKTGMNEQEVTALMGDPFMVQSKQGGVIWVWSYADAFAGTKTVTVVFVDGKVAEPPPIPASFK